MKCTHQKHVGEPCQRFIRFCEAFFCLLVESPSRVPSPTAINERLGRHSRNNLGSPESQWRIWLLRELGARRRTVTARWKLGGARED